MKNLVPLLNDIYLPVKALIVFKNEKNNGYYVESYDMDNNGCPINAHPLSVLEGNDLAEMLNSSPESKQVFLRSEGLLPENVLFINANRDGFVIWFTPPMEVNLFFKADLSIPDGKAKIPAMVWKATNKSLQVYALKTHRKPSADAQLHHAPFFNVYQNGGVCMGNVDIKISGQTGLEEFMSLWQTYFFNSKFSHLNGVTSPVKGNIIQLWNKLISGTNSFPVKSLIKTDKNLKDLLS